MGISRRLPVSDEDRKAALVAAKAKNDATAVAARHLSAPTQTRLNDITGDFVSAMQARGSGLAGQSSKTSQVTAVKQLAHQYVSHFIQVFNLGVARQKYPKDERAFFQLPINSDALPSIVTEQDIIDWGMNIVTGDTERLAAGGIAMSNPGTAEVAAAVEAFTLLNTEQSALKLTYDNAQETVANLRPEADAVIKKVWDETETFYNEETPSSMRRKCREWGEKYVSTTELTFNFTLSDSATGNAIENLTVTLTDTNNAHNTNASGQVTIKSTVADEATFSYEHPDYITKEETIELPANQTVYNISVSMVHI